MVMLQKASEVRNQGGSMRTLYLKALAGLAVTGIAPFALLWAFGAWVISFVLGESWADAGRYVEILVPWYFATWVGALVPPFMVALRRQDLWLVMQVLVLVCRVGAFAYCFWIDASVETVLQAFAWVNVSLSAMMISVGYVETGKWDA
jgi:O-antigen/teichoic acid export membrane protein